MASLSTAGTTEDSNAPKGQDHCTSPELPLKSTLAGQLPKAFPWAPQTQKSVLPIPFMFLFPVTGQHLTSLKSGTLTLPALPPIHHISKERGLYLGFS